MSHDDHATGHVEHEDHGDHGDHGHPHGHAPAAWEIIPEGSGTDKFLIMLAFVALIGLFAFSGFMLTAPEHHEHSASYSADEMPSGEHGAPVSEHGAAPSEHGAAPSEHETAAPAAHETAAPQH